MNPTTFDTLATLLRNRSGLVIGQDKVYLLESRLLPIAKRENLAGLDGLAAKLRAPGADPLTREVVEAMTTNESFFFRDGKPFTHVQDHALANIVAARPATATLRIWSAAASTGQEAYSLAMLVTDKRPLIGARKVEIIGTDLAREPLARAREGVYSQFEVQRGLPVQMLMKHFKKEDTNWRISQAMRDMVKFQELNLLGDLRGLGQFDIVFLRNVLIYFDAPTKGRVLEAIAKQMAPDGYLYLGGAETVLGISDRFTAAPDGHGVYAPVKPGAATLPRPTLAAARA
jgi:chemotaxis protein methyltransferase CheR